MEDIIGQKELFAEGSPFSRMIKTGHISSLILWGPAGVGKTTIARLLAHKTNLVFESISAIFSGVSDLKKIFEQAQVRQKMNSKTAGTLLFVDEIHRFNRAQQDAFLPYIESGVIILVGATTENPSFELNSALLSRLQVFTVTALSKEDLEKLLKRAEKTLNHPLPLTEKARDLFLEMAGGDGRYLLNMAESLSLLPSSQAPLSPEELVKSLQKRALLYDKDREEHYNLISALHKSIRASDPHAALYWLMRMLEGGEDRRFIARRLIRAALEDIGLADPEALALTLNALKTFERLGSPEGDLALSQATLYLALAPKSNKVYEAHKKAQAFVQKTGSLPPPPSLLNAPTRLMKELGYGKGYCYDHDMEEGVSGQNCWPVSMEPSLFYEPTGRGQEKKLQERLCELQSVFENWKKEQKNSS
ncbi:MAG: replication-associated recombination protein A [Proteobacteria bacterium]|nr:replication-associated recombination protein A [Pseudomonadota bacterium]